jgi:hypothetical protein
MKKLSFQWSKNVLRHVLPVAVAALSLAGAKAAQAADWTVYVDPASPNDHTQKIQEGLSSGSSYNRVILPYRSAGWTTGPLQMNVAGKELWIQGSGSNPGKLTAKRGGTNFSATDSNLITVNATGCTINGYSNGVNKTSGVATLTMWKSDYIAPNYVPSEHRHIIENRFDNVTIKGVLLKNAGGDGIYLFGGSGNIIKDVITDGSNRNGVSVIKHDNLRISDSTFKNSSGGAATGTLNGPHAGIDFEPNGPTHNLTDIQVSNCIFSGNAKSNILVSLQHLGGTGVGSTCDIWFYNCTSTDAGDSAVYVKGMRSDGPTLGRVYFQDTTMSNSRLAGIKVQQWVADHTRITFNRFNMTDCDDAGIYGPIYLEDSSSQTVTDTLGDITFQNGCYVNDYGSSHASILYGMSFRVQGAPTATKWKDITGQIFYRCNYTPAITPADAWHFSNSVHEEENIALTMTPY